MAGAAAAAAALDRTVGEALADDPDRRPSGAGAGPSMTWM